MFVAREIKQTLLHKFGKFFFDSPFTSRITTEKVQITTKKSEQIAIKHIGKTRGSQAKKSNTMRVNKRLQGIHI